MYQKYINIKTLLEIHQEFTTRMKTAAYIRNPKKRSLTYGTQ